MGCPVLCCKKSSFFRSSTYFSIFIFISLHGNYNFAQLNPHRLWVVIGIVLMSRFRGSFNFWVYNSQFRKILRTVTLRIIFMACEKVSGAFCFSELWVNYCRVIFVLLQNKVFTASQAAVTTIFHFL